MQTVCSGSHLAANDVKLWPGVTATPASKSLANDAQRPQPATTRKHTVMMNVYANPRVCHQCFG
jgi:hypothetical protein